MAPAVMRMRLRAAIDRRSAETSFETKRFRSNVVSLRTLLMRSLIFARNVLISRTAEIRPDHCLMRWLPAAVLALLGTVPALAQEKELPLQWSGFSFFRGAYAGAPPSWLAEGHGKFSEGDGAAGSTQAHLGIDWRPSMSVAGHVHLIGRMEQKEPGRGRVGVAE